MIKDRIKDNGKQEIKSHVTEENSKNIIWILYEQPI